MTEELRLIITGLQKGHADQAEELRKITDRFGPEVETKLSLVLRYRDEFLKRIEEVENDTEQLKKDMNDRLGNNETQMSNAINN